MKKMVITEISISVLALLFVYAAFSKWFDMERFQASLEKQPFPHWLQGLLAAWLPPVELMAAVLLFVPSARLVALLAYSVMMTIFTGYIAAILMHVFPRVPCTCGGLISELSWGQHLLFNLVFILLAVWQGLTIFHARNQVQMAKPDKNRPIISFKKINT